ncbi:MAG: tetratricopeptide repeat protein [Micropepsaceae bacterium]
MPILILAEVLIQAACIYHASQRGTIFPWIYVIMIPGIGPVAYFLFEILPDTAKTRRGQKVVTDLRTVLDPDREFRERRAEAELTQAPATKAAFAEECARRGMHDEAVTMYRSALSGTFADDAHLMLGLARAQIGKCDCAGCQQTLDQLRAKNPDFNSPEGHLLYARALEGLNKDAEALHEYEALSGYYPGLEAKVRHALYLQKLGRVEQSRPMLETIVANFKRLPRHAQELNRDWANVARRNLEG